MSEAEQQVEKLKADYEDRTRRHAENAECLLERIEKLTKERDEYENAAKNIHQLVRMVDVIWNGEKGAAPQASLCDMVSQLSIEVPELREQLAALAEQKEKMRSALIAISVAWSSNDVYSHHFFQEALSLPDLATPVLNKYRTDELEAGVA